MEHGDHINKVKVQVIEPDAFYLVDSFCDQEGIPRLDPNWSRVIAGIDTKLEKVVGIMVLQLVAHAEPIWIEEAYRGNGLWKEMADMADGYFQEMADNGILKGVYTQPTSEESVHIAKAMGMEECEFPLFVKKFVAKES